MTYNNAQFSYNYFPAKYNIALLIINIIMRIKIQDVYNVMLFKKTLSLDSVNKKI